MNFFQSVKICFVDFLNFKRRAQRSEYWWFQLFSMLGFLFCFALDYGVLNYSFGEQYSYTPFIRGFELLTFLPLISVTARRLHDVGKSGWWQAPVYVFYLEYFIDFPYPEDDRMLLWLDLPLVLYTLLLFIFLIRDGHPEANRYGENPKRDVHRAA